MLDWSKQLLGLQPKCQSNCIDLFKAPDQNWTLSHFSARIQLFPDTPKSRGESGVRKARGLNKSKTSDHPPKQDRENRAKQRPKTKQNEDQNKHVPSKKTPDSNKARLEKEQSIRSPRFTKAKQRPKRAQKTQREEPTYFLAFTMARNQFMDLPGASTGRRLESAFSESAVPETG